MIARDDLLDAAEGWAMALVPPRPPAMPDTAFAERLREDADALRSKLILPLLCAASCPLRGKLGSATRPP